MSSKSTFEIPGPPFELKLSHWDARFPPVYSRRIFCLGLKPGNDHEAVVTHLQNAMRQTVEELPYLAGSIVSFTPEKGGGLLRTIETTGSAKLVINDLTSQISYEELKSQGFPQSALDHALFCPYEKISYTQLERVDVCGVQANMVSGGVLLVISIINVVSDGGAIAETIRIFAKNLRRSQVGSEESSSCPSPYRVDRTVLLNGHGYPGNIDIHPAWIVTPKASRPPSDSVITIRQNVRITAKNLPLLKQEASANLPEGAWISTHDAIVGLVWRSLAVARRKAGLIISGDSPTTLTQAVDCRKMLGLPHPYLGNAIHAINPQVKCVDLSDAERGLALAALTIRKAIQDVTPDVFKDLMGYIERTQNPVTLAAVQHLDQGGIFLTSHFKFGMVDVDFGPMFESVDACLQPTSSMTMGAPHILSKMPDGSCVIMLNERDEVVKHLRQDSIFTRYAEFVERCV